jgi:hypothetical protein
MYAFDVCTMFVWQRERERERVKRKQCRRKKIYKIILNGTKE